MIRIISLKNKINLHVWMQLYRAWIIDHAILRFFWNNFAQISLANNVYRSGHPSRRLLNKFKKKGGSIVLNLRGGQNLSHNQLERRYCKEFALTLMNIKFKSDQAPNPTSLLELLDFFDRTEKCGGILMHCKTGADRTGLAAALYLIHREKVSVDVAVQQLSKRYLHFGTGKKKILKGFYTYLQKTKKSDQSLRDWI